MYKEESKDQQKLEDFYLPFGGHLNPKNRWVVLSKRIPWDKLEADYADQFSSSGMGAPAKSFRMALGSLIIKEKLQISDAETVEQIQETPTCNTLLGWRVILMMSHHLIRRWLVTMLCIVARPYNPDGSLP